MAINFVSDPGFSIIARLPPYGTAGSTGAYFMAGSLAELPGGTLVAAISQGHDRPPRGHGLDSLVICGSSDRGASWRRSAMLPWDSTEPVLYARDGRLYLFLTPNRREYEQGTFFPREENGRIWVSFSDDAGASWSVPRLVLKGIPPYTSGGQTALLEHAGNLYWTVSDRYQSLAVIRVRLDRDLSDPDAWEISDLAAMPIPPELAWPAFRRGSRLRCLEGNVVTVSGRLLVISRAVINGGATANTAALFEITDRPGRRPQLQFLQFHPVPGGHLKFYIQADRQSGLYWMVSNLSVNAAFLAGGGTWEEVRKLAHPGVDRRALLLWYSLDALNWVPAGWVARAGGWKQSFSYPVMLISGDDLLIISRTGHASKDQHDVDMATFHRVRGFRALAADLSPEATRPPGCRPPGV